MPIIAKTMLIPSLYGASSPTRRLAEGQKCWALRTGASSQVSLLAAAANSSTSSRLASTSGAEEFFF